MNDTTALECITDCRQAAACLDDANEMRFETEDAIVFTTDLFKVRVSSADRALRRAEESRAKLQGASHSRAVRICSRACAEASELLKSLTTDIKDRDSVSDLAAKLLRHCERSLP